MMTTLFFFFTVPLSCVKKHLLILVFKKTARFKNVFIILFNLPEMKNRRKNSSVIYKRSKTTC